MTRDSLTLWLAALGALASYLIADGRPPMDWAYGDWLKLIAFAIAWGVGKLQSSPLPGK